MDWRVPLADLDYGEAEEQAVLSVLRSRWLTMGSITRRFEETFAEMHGVKYAMAVSNATVGLHLACLALGIGPGDEVIVPSLTFVASANAVLYTGASVRFADIAGADDLTIAPEEIEALISPKTRAILVVHYGGYACRMEKIMEIAARHGLPVIEDAAHAPLSRLGDRFLGSWGEVGCFSFFSNKNLSTGEGGMVVTDREDIAEKVRNLRSHGMTSLTWDRHQGHAYTYDVTALGYNYRIDEIRSALGIVQLEKLANNNRLRKWITQNYWQAFQGSEIGLPFQNHPGEPAYHIFPILLPVDIDRIQFIDQMRAEGIQTSIHYPPIHEFRYYRQQYPGVRLPRTETVGAREVTLPLYPAMKEIEIGLVVSAVQKAVKACKSGESQLVQGR